MDRRIDAVIEFWFGDGSTSATSRWFTKSPTFDNEIRTRFGDLHAIAAAGGLEDWRGRARGELALIVLLDQFSRNLFRDDPRAFAQDERALELARELVATRRIVELRPIERMIAMMRYEHAEDREIQRESVALFERLAADHPGDAMLAGAFDYAKRHAEIIERFDRFPHRNKLLGRDTTPEEAAFLTQPGSSF